MTEDMTNLECADEYGKEIDCEIGTFSNPSFEGALLGFTAEGKAVYDYDLMVESFMLETGCNEFEALDFVSSDILSACFGEYTPIVIFSPAYLTAHNDIMRKKMEEHYEKWASAHNPEED